jgi:SNF2 family DNA or RNA helicase
MDLIVHKFQERTAIRAIIKRGVGIFAEPGTGKTIIGLRAIQIANPTRVLIVAPRLVAWHVWPAEIKKWSTFKDLSYTVIHNKFQFDPTAQIHIVNPESLKSPIIKSTEYQMVIVDESTLYKSRKSQRFKRLYAIAKHCKYRIVLTGNPIPRDYMDLFSQMKLVDFGESLYPKIGQYRTRYFNAIPKRVNALLTIDEYVLKKGADKMIQKAIKPRTEILTGLIELPPLIERDIVVRMDRSDQTQYDGMEKEMFAEIENEKIFSFSSGSKYRRCHQLANGACYDDNRRVLTLHDLKIRALENLIWELDGSPLLVAYMYNHDKTRIMKALPNARAYDETALDDWNKSKVPVLLAQYANMSHGLNLQGGGRHLACFSLTDNYDHYYQIIRRLHRQGAKSKTFVHRIITDKTVDLPILDRLNKRQQMTRDFIGSLRAYQFLKTKGPKGAYFSGAPETTDGGSANM